MKKIAFRLLTVIVSLSLLFSSLPVYAMGIDDVAPIGEAIAPEKTNDQNDDTGFNKEAKTEDSDVSLKTNIPNNDLPEKEANVSDNTDIRKSLGANLTASSTTYTSGYYTYTIVNKEVTIIKVDTSISGRITIPSALGNYYVTRIGSYAFQGCNKITSVSVENYHCIERISEYAFIGCTGLQSITIPGKVEYIGKYAFGGCTGLKSVTIPSTVSYISRDAFEGCSNLTSIIVDSNNRWYESENNCVIWLNSVIIGCKNSIIPNSVTSIGDRAFYGCTGLTSVTIPDSVTSIGESAFYGCTGLTSATIGSGVTSIGDYAFYGCTGLTSVTIPDSVTSIGGYAFDSCTGLTSATIGSGVTSIGVRAFYGCTGLTSVTIPDSVTSIGTNVFYNTAWYNNQPNGLVYAGKVAYEYKGICPTSVQIKEGTLGIAYCAFYNSIGLTSITIPDSVTNIGNYAFYGCTGLTSVTIPDSVTSIGDSAFYGCTGLTSTTIGSGVTSIGSSAFAYCTELCNIAVNNKNSKYRNENNCLIENSTNIIILGCKNSIIPDSVTSIGNHAFYDCTGLTSVTIPDSVTSIGDSAFYGCTGLTSATIGSGVTSIGNYAFYGCTGLTSVTIPDSVTRIGDYAFYGCTGLTSATIGSGVTSIGVRAFYGCTGLTSATIGSGVTSIDFCAFDYCPKLVEVINKSCLTLTKSSSGYGYVAYHAKEIHSDESHIIEKEDFLFYTYNGVNYLLGYIGESADLVLPENYNGQNYQIYDYAFYNCSKMTSVTIGNSVTRIGDRAFYGCTGLTSATIGSGVTSIGSYAFGDCYKLVEVINKSCLTLTKGSKENGYVAYYALDVHSENSKIDIKCDYIFFLSNGINYLIGYVGTDTNLVLPKNYNGQEYQINQYAFEGCSGLTSVTIPSSITKIGNYAFYNCAGLKTINYLGTKAQWSKISIGTNNTYLTNATRYYNGHTLTVRFVGINGNELFDTVEQFISAGDSYSVPVPELEYHITEPETVSGIMPKYDHEITVTYFENPMIASGTCGENIGWKLYENGKLVLKGSGAMADYTSGNAPWYQNADKVTEIILDPRITTIGNYAFENITKITDVDFGYSLKTIGTGAFKSCSEIKSVVFPSTVTNIGNEAFSGCSKITSVVVPDNVKTVGSKAFYNCPAVKTVKLGSGVETIGTQAFDGCTALSEIYFYGKPVAATSTTFGTPSGKILYYYSTVPGWTAQITDGKWNGYTAIPYNAIAKQTTSSVTPYIIKVVDKNNVSLEGATVVLGSVSQTTDKDGRAYFAKPVSPVKLTVSCSKHITYSDTSYNTSRTQLMDIIVLSDKPATVQGVRCNEKSIASSVYTLNCNSSDSINIAVLGSTKQKIYKYELLQGNRVLQTINTDSDSCTFSVKASAFEEGNSVFVKMYTADGNSVCQALNIDVVKIADISRSTLLDELSSLNMLVDLGRLGKVNLPLNFRTDNKAKIYTSLNGRTIHVGINLDVEKLAKNFKNGSDASLRAYMQKQVDSALEKKAKPKDSIDYNVCGYLEIEYLGNGQYYVKTCYTKVSVQLSLGFKAQASYFGLVGVYFKATVSGESSLALKVTRYQPEQGFTISDLSFSVEDRLSLEAGVYILFKFGTASVYGSGSMGFEIQIIPNTEVKHVYLKAEAGVKWSLVWGLISGSYKIWSGTIYEWPSNYNQKALKALYASALYAAYSDPDNYSINDRSYLENRSEWLSTQKKLLKALSAQSGYYDLQTNVYSGIAPKVVTCGDTTVMVWLDDNAGRDVSNYQTLYYSVYNKNTNTWSTPMQLDKNNTFDCEFDLFTDGEKIYVLYTEQKNEASDIEQLDIEDAEAIAAYVANIEVRYAMFENGVFSDPIAVTDNNVCEILPSLTVIDGVLTAVWNVTDMLGLSETDTKDTVYISKYIDGIWTTPVAVAANQNMVSSVATGVLSGEQYTAYITDADNSRETSDDISLILASENGIALQIDSGMISNVSFAEIAGKPSLVWNKDGKIYYVFSADGDVICALPETNYVHADYHIITLNDGQTMLTFVQESSTDNKDGSDVFGVYIGENGYYGSVVKLTDTNGYVDHYDVTEVDGRIVVVLTDSIADFVGDNVTSTTDLRYVIIDLNADIAINSINYDISDVENGKTFEVTAEIENIGWKDIGGIKVNLYDKDNQIVYQAEKELSIKSGETVTDTIEICTPETLDLGNYTLEIIPNNDVRDGNLSDNTKTIVFAFSDVNLSVEQKIIGEKTTLLLFVKNDGNVSTPANISVYAGANEIRSLDTIHIDSINAGETLQFSVDLDGLIAENDTIITCVVTSEYYDPCIENNTETVSLFRVKSEGYISVNGNTVENPELSSNTGAYDKYNDDLLEISIEVGSDHFVGITGLQSGVDYSVTDNKVLFSKTYLLSLPLGDNEFTFEFDYGEEKPVLKTFTITVSDTTPITITGTVKISGNAVVGGTVIVDVSNITPATADFICQWKLDNIVVGDGDSYIIPIDAYAKTLTVTIIGLNGYVGETSTSSMVDYAVQYKPNKPILQNVSSTSVSVATVPGVEYSLDGILWQTNGIFDNLEPVHKYSIFARYAQTDTAYASEAIEISVTTLKKNAEKAVAPEVVEKTDIIVKLKYIDGYEYRCNDGEWQNNNEFAGLNPDTEYIFYQRIAETNDTYASETSECVSVITLVYKFTLSGTVTSFGKKDEAVTVKLFSQSGELIDSLTTTDGSYLFKEIVSGTYMLEISKSNHARRIYEITGKDSGVIKDVKIHLIGDINGDGKVNITDVNKANAHANKTKFLTGYEFDCANINGDNDVNITDVNKMNAHANKSKYLW